MVLLSLALVGTAAQPMSSVLGTNVLRGPSVLGGTTRPSYTCAEAKDGKEVIFDCGGEVIHSVMFASYGKPGGHCDSSGVTGQFLANPACHSPRSTDALEERCLGGSTCMFVVSAEMFGEPCAGQEKWFSATLECGDHAAAAVLAAEEARRTAGQQHLSTGWKFVIFVFALFGLYFTLGIAYSVRRLGTPLGIEAVPHLAMWQDLPFLVRDGIVFSIDTIKSKGRPQYQTVL